MQKIILLHGAIGSKEQLEPLAGLLKNSYDVYTLNFSGHGGAPFNTDFSIEKFSNELLHFMDAEQIGSANIFGYSMGGYVAMYLAKHYPERVNKIITLATKFHWDEAVAAKELKMLDADVIEQKVPAFAAQLKSRHAPNDWRDVLAKTKQMLTGLGRRNRLDLDDYRTITQVSLLLLGDQDKMVTKEETISVSEALLKGAFQSLPSTPHPIEQVDETVVGKIISDFLLQ